MNICDFPCTSLSSARRSIVCTLIEWIAVCLLASGSTPKPSKSPAGKAVSSAVKAKPKAAAKPKKKKKKRDSDDSSSEASASSDDDWP